MDEGNYQIIVPEDGYDGKRVILRTDENRQQILIDFACGLSWAKVSKKYGCSQEALRKWMLTDIPFREDYLKAKQFDAEFLLERIKELADAADELERYPDVLMTPDGAVVRDAEGEPAVHPKAGELLPGEREKHSRIRTQIEGLRIVLEKRMPRKYGQLVKLADADGEKLNVTVAQFGMVSPPSRNPMIDVDADDLEVVDG